MGAFDQRSQPVRADWVTLPAAADQPTLRCWWARPGVGQPRAAVLLLPEVFGLNPWIRSVAERIAAEGYGVLALPIFARSAPDLALGYDDGALVEGRQHRDAVTAAGLLHDARRAISWLQQQSGLVERPLACVGFCFGGHLSLLVATLPQVALTCDFYGARVSSFRPGGGPPTLEVLPQIQGDLICLCGELDPLIPPEELDAIAAALQASDSDRRRELMVLPGAGHGFMCEARADFDPAAARVGWQTLLAALEQSLGG